MSLIVQKFGGSSVGTLERIAHVAHKIKETRMQGYNLVVVVSAMQGETDKLIQLSKQISDFPEPREYAALISTGEQISAALLAIMLQKIGCPARSLNAYQINLLTDNDYRKARILDINTTRLKTEINNGFIPIVTGFQGISASQDITTLGRGGSDTTAVALAAALKATECQIYTDVEGVYTADPRIVSNARLLKEITFEEMMELSGLGAKVLQPRSVELAGKYRVPLRVLSSFKEGPGTLIMFEDKRVEKPIVSGITFNRQEAKLTIKGVAHTPDAVAKIIQPIAKANIDIDMIIQNAESDGKIDLTFTISRDDYTLAFEILSNTAKFLKAKEITGDAAIAKLSIVGVGMRSHSGIASRVFSVLANEGINIKLISTSEIKISVVIDEKYLELGVRALHTAFGLDNDLTADAEQSIIAA